MFNELNYYNCKFLGKLSLKQHGFCLKFYSCTRNSRNLIIGNNVSVNELFFLKKFAKLMT